MSVLVITERWRRNEEPEQMETEYSDADGFGTGPQGELLVLKQSRLDNKTSPVAIYAPGEWVSAEVC